MSSTTTSFVLAAIIAIKQKISRMTQDFFRLIKEYRAYQAKKEAFAIRNSLFEEAGFMLKIRWFMVLFLVVPILIVLDFASLKIFIDFLQSKVDGFGRMILSTFSIVLFFILELAIALAVIKINEKLETKNSIGLRFLRFLLMVLMIILPSALILAGHLLNPIRTFGESFKIGALITLSLIVNTAFFLLMDDLMKAIGYVTYLINRSILKFKNPESKLEASKILLRTQYNMYDYELVKFSEMPESSTYSSTIALSKREKFLKERLEDDIEDNDYEEFTDTKRVASTHPKSTIGAVTTTPDVW